MTSRAEELTELAFRSTNECRALAETREGWEYMGYVGSALQTISGTTFTGINLYLHCGIGFCAEHSAVAEMLKHGETRIDAIVAVSAAGEILPPCGRCRELLYQVDQANRNTEVILAGDRSVTLGDLLPINWQDYMAALQ